MTLHRSTCIPAPEFSHRETEEPVPPQGTLERLLLRTEQTGWSVVYHFFVISSNLTTINTRTIGSVLTLHRHFHLSPLDTGSEARRERGTGHLLCGTK